MKYWPLDESACTIRIDGFKYLSTTTFFIAMIFTIFILYSMWFCFFHLWSDHLLFRRSGHSVISASLYIGKIKLCLSLFEYISASTRMVKFLLDLIDLIDFLTLDLTCLIFGDWVIPTLILFMGTKFEIKEISIDCIIIHTMAI